MLLLLSITDQQKFVFALIVALVVSVLYFVRKPQRLGSSLVDWIGNSSWKGPLLAALLVLGLRGALQPVLHTPEPNVHDEFAYLLMGDTFAHFRLTNPTPPAWHHFETFQENMVPTYQGRYPFAQGATLAVGELLGNPWLGVYFSTGLMVAAVCWALQGFVSPGWALFGGVVCGLRLGIFSYWMNTYWGGSVAALGGALALGAAARLLQCATFRRDLMTNGAAFGVGLSILANSRPFEGAAFSIPLAAVLGGHWFMHRRTGKQNARPAVLCAVGVLAFSAIAMGIYNDRVTGSAWTMPYFNYERTYASTPLFISSPPPPQRVYRHEAMKLLYASAKGSQYDLTNSPDGLWYAESHRWRHFEEVLLGLPLLLPFGLGLIAVWREWPIRLAAWCLLFEVIACSCTVGSLPHYFAPATVTVYLLVVLGLRSLWGRQSMLLRTVSIGLCALVLIGALVGSDQPLDYYSPISNRQLAHDWLQTYPGKQLVEVEYYGRHDPALEIVFNGAEPDSQKIVWARKMSDAEDAELCRAYPDRSFWTLKTNDKNVTLGRNPVCQGHSVPQQN